MSKLIYADSLRQDILALPNCYNGFSDTYDKACIIGVIDEQQPVDAVEVVRCKDCKYRYVDGENVRFNVCELNHNKVQPDDWYCGDAERRNDED